MGDDRPIRRVIVLGSTGSVGTQALEVIDELNALGIGTRYEVAGLAAGRSVHALAEQRARWPSARTALCNARAGAADFTGDDAACELVRSTPADLVIAAIVGLGGLGPVLAAIDAGVDVALANKESLVAAGAIVMARAQQTGARILPLDSEHSGVWQCLLGVAGRAYAPPMPIDPAVERIILTASGGPFRTWARERIERATRDEALAHPVWAMGPKNTIDSATLMNKGLELIEARWLFDCQRLDVLVHPSSSVHAVVDLADGQSLCQLAVPDMRLPIHLALAFPDRAPSPRRRLDLAQLGSLVFETPDRARFPALALAERAMHVGGTAGAVLSAANEVAVEAFLAGRIAFGRIPALVEHALDRIDAGSEPTLGAVLEADARAREIARSAI